MRRRERCPGLALRSPNRVYNFLISYGHKRLESNIGTARLMVFHDERSGVYGALSRRRGFVLLSRCINWQLATRHMDLYR
jgi:hypothetical protein